MLEFWNKINHYTNLTQEGKEAWQNILKRKAYKKNQFFLQEGDTPLTVAFVSRGLFSQYHTTENGDMIIKRFFSENYFVASKSALLKKGPSIFTIKSLEDSSVWEYDFQEFKRLTEKHPDIAAFYIKYMELHWIIEKEPLELSLRYDPAKIKYEDFLKTYPTLEARLKQHEIASYLGITPTQLSRIRSGQ